MLVGVDPLGIGCDGSNWWYAPADVTVEGACDIDIRGAERWCTMGDVVTGLDSDFQGRGLMV